MKSPLPCTVCLALLSAVLSLPSWAEGPLLRDLPTDETSAIKYLRLDFAAPRGSETTISPAGLAVLRRLPLTVLNLENAHTFTPAHFETIASIKTLESLLIDARQSEVPSEAVNAFRQRRPDVQVVIAGPDAKGPPRAK